MKELLRPVGVGDLEMIRKWRNAPNVRNNMYTNHVISKPEHQRWWEKTKSNERARILILEDNDQPLGFVSFTNYTGIGGSATWAFYSGETSRRGIGSMMEHAALEYAFDELGLFRLECEVLSFNKPVVDFHLRHGFEVEGLKKKCYERDGQRYSIYQLAMLRERWERHIRPMLERKEGIRASLSGLSLSWSDLIGAAVVDQYSNVTGDNNPIHLEDDAARKSGFEGRISHGMLVGGLLSRYFANEFPGRGTIYLSQTLSFKAPILVGDKVDHELRVDWHIGKRIGVSTQSSVKGVTCVEGKAELLLPDGDWKKENFA